MNMQTLTLNQHLNETEKNYVKAMLCSCTNLRSLAEQAGISYSTLWRKMKKHGLYHDK